MEVNKSQKLEVKSKNASQKEFDIRKRAYKFALEILQLSKKLPNNPVGWSIASQLIRSATSVSANLVEAKGASSTADFLNFYHYSLKSCNETTHWLCLIRDSNEILDSERVKSLINESTELSKIIATIILKIKKKEK